MKFKWNRWTKPFCIVMLVQVVLWIILWLLPVSENNMQTLSILKPVATILLIGTSCQCLLYINYWSKQK